MMTATASGSSTPLVRRFLTEAARNRVTVSLLVVVPVIFVAVAGGSIAELKVFRTQKIRY